LTLSGITGSGFQCLHANNTGVVSGTGTDCGSGGGGAVNTVSNADGTLTIAPTAGNVVASLNLAHANTWTGAHTWTGGGANKILDVTSPNVGVNTGGNTIPGIFSVGWANTPSTANRVLFTVDDTANSVNGHWITSTLGVPGGLYTLGSAGVGGSGIVYTMNANVGNNTGSFPFFYQQWFNTTVASGTGGGVTGLFVEVITNGAWTPGATGNPGPNALQTLAEADTGGFVFGINPFARCKLVACAQVVGAEVDVDNQINGTSSKIGIQVIEGPTSTGTVTGDAPAYLAGSVNGLGFKAVLQLGLSNATAFPLTSTGAVIKAYAKSGGSTIADGIDLTGSGNTLTITGCTIKGPSGFCVNGVGHIAAGGLPTVTSCGASAAVSAGSTDTGGTATAQAASCVIVFATTYATTPNCVANDNTRASALTVAANPGAFQVTGLTAGDLFAWVCIGKSTL
jgi:hypothetical protein